jgi:gas vesicle protein
MKIIKKYVLADTIFHQNTSLFSIVKSVWLTLIISLIIAFVASVLLLISSIYFDLIMYLILGFDVILIYIIYKQVKKRLSSKVKEAFIDALSRKFTVWINTFILLVIFVVYQFFTAPIYEIKEFNCEILNFLSSMLHYKELLEWKFMSNSIGTLQGSKNVFAWLFYLLVSQGIFAWAYSRLLLSVSISKSIIERANDKKRNYFLFGFLATIFLLFVVTLSINHLYEKKHIQNVQTQINIAYKEADKQINAKLNSGEEALIKDINAVIDSEIEKVFESVYESIPQLSDYYYSVKGEYSRIILKGFSLYCGYKNDYLVPYYNKYLPDGYKLKQCNSKMLDDEIESKINLYLFEKNDFSNRVDKASNVIDASIKNSMNDFKDELDKSLNTLENRYKTDFKSLESDFNKIFEASSRDAAKKGLSATGTLLISGAITKSIMSKMLLKFGAKGAAKASSFIGGSLTGLSICAPSGPWAFLCGVVTGTISWVGVDAAMTEVDQAFNEDDFELSVKKMIDAQKNSLKNLMKDSYKEWVQNIFAQLKKDTDNLKSPYEQVR